MFVDVCVCVSVCRCIYISGTLTFFSSILQLSTSHINEDKRKTEGQKQIFDVVYEVDGCPVSLITVTVLCMHVDTYCSMAILCFIKPSQSTPACFAYHL